jgi:hypothetical protein
VPDIEEIMTDTAEGHLDEKSLISSTYDRAPTPRWGINGLNATSPEAGTRIRDKTGEKQFEFNENNHEKRNQINN